MGARWRWNSGARSSADHRAVDPEPREPCGRARVEVRIEGLLVGYLSREDAAVYQPGLLHLMEAHRDAPLIALRGVIVGGGLRGGRLGYLGVFLDHDPADFGLRAHHVSHGEVRTGRSEEMDSDPAEMTWLGRLPEDDYAAAGQLQELLGAADAAVATALHVLRA